MTDLSAVRLKPWVTRAHFGSCFLKVIYSFSDHNLLPNLVLSGALGRVRSK